MNTKLAQTEPELVKRARLNLELHPIIPRRDRRSRTWRL